MNEVVLKEIKQNFLKKESNLCLYACLSEQAIRIYKEEDEREFRPAFYHDTDRIIHSLSYTRYLNKTQVFSFSKNDHLSKRIIHVQLVSKIARTIGRALSLNEDLIEAIALGHDIGHTPIGHVGEAILNEISKRELGEIFAHNVQSVRVYKDLERNQTGCNLSIQVLDGILCHNGEILSNVYHPSVKTKESFLEEYKACYHNERVLRQVRPMTLEGCVVRISDIIGYIGRDIEDAIEIGVITREDIPKNIVQILGVDNRTIVNTLIQDIIVNSLGKPYIKMSSQIFQALMDLKKFNYQNIYNKANTMEQINFYKESMNQLFKECLKDLTENKTTSSIYQVYLKNIRKEYLEQTNPKRIVIDYIAGMTDEFFLKSIKNLKNMDADEESCTFE